jgi:hypothetical protein
MTTFRWMISLLVALMVMALTANVFANQGVGYGVKIHPYVYYATLALALAMPVLWAFGHVMMGAVMGFSGGGMKEGLKLGVILGLGMALGRSWLNVAAVAGGIALGQGPIVWAMMTAVLAVGFLALNWAISFIWRDHQAQV